MIADDCFTLSAFVEWKARQGRQKRVLLFYYYYIIHRIPRISYPQMPFPSSKTPFRPHAPCRWLQLPNRRNLNKSHSNHHPTASPFPCHLQHPQQSRRSSPSLPHDAEWLMNYAICCRCVSGFKWRRERGIIVLH